MTKLVVLALITYVFATADTLVLKNGSHVDGIFLGGDARSVKFEANDRVGSYPVADVDSVRFTSGTAPTTPTPPAPAPSPVRPAVQIMANTAISVRLIDRIRSVTAAPGSVYRASVDVPIYGGGRIVIPAYSSAVVQIVDRSPSGHMTGNTSLTLALTKVEVGGTVYNVSTTEIVEASNNRGSTSAKITGGTAAAGAVLGAIAGGGRGAGIGVGSGAVVGAAASVLRPGQKVNLASKPNSHFAWLLRSCFPLRQLLIISAIRNVFMLPHQHNSPSQRMRLAHAVAMPSVWALAPRPAPAALFSLEISDACSDALGAGATHISSIDTRTYLI